MRHKYFLVYFPFMIIMGFLSIWLAKRYNGVATMSGYRIDKMEAGAYDGAKINDASIEERKTVKNQDTYNGTLLKDNGKPYAIKVNKKRNVVTVYEAGENGNYDKPVKAMLCSVGETGNTPEGVYKLGERYKWRALFGDCFGQYAIRITGNILFHSVPYYTRDKSDLEVEEYNNLGKSVSAGCVRLTVVDVKWIYDNCENGTLVEIFESDYEGPMGRPQTPQIKKNKDENWDPTDPDLENPYMKDTPVILGAYDRVINRYSDFDITAGVTALDSNGEDITKYMKVQGVVDGDTCGEYPVTYTVADIDDNEDNTDDEENDDEGDGKGEEKGKETSVSVIFTVKDEESPILKVDQVVSTISVSDTTSDEHLVELLKQNVTAYDGEDVLPEDNIIVDYSELFEKTYGKCHIKYRAKDSEGNMSDVVVLTVDVDLEAPTLTFKNEFQRDIRKNKILDDEYLISLVEATDNSDNVEVSISRPLRFNEDEPYKVMYYAKDKVGNITTLSVTYQLK